MRLVSKLKNFIKKRKGGRIVLLEVLGHNSTPGCRVSSKKLNQITGAGASETTDCFQSELAAQAVTNVEI